MKPWSCLVTALCLSWLGAPVLAGSPSASFERDVQPILRRCLQCHGPGKAKAGLRLDSLAAAIRGLRSGNRAIVPGHPDESELLHRVATADAHKRMPPKGPRLKTKEVATLRRWIAAGAHWPLHWAYRPLLKPPLPTDLPDAYRRWPRTAIDYFIVTELRRHGLTPAPEADRRTLLRRVYFDLVGLPPTPAEMDRFLTDGSPDAYERVVDRLLASPAYGERWARHWMDIAHFAETHGHDQDRPRDHAWPYRDYLIRSFNKDKPYPRFVEEQIAGDVLWPADSDGIIATGFLAAGPWDESSLRDIREDSIDREIGRVLDRDDIVTTVMGTFASTTVGCARCHDHKFDPIPQAEYYGLQAVFAGIDKANRAFDLNPRVAARRRELQHQKATPAIKAQLAGLPPLQLVYCGTNHFSADGSFRRAQKPRPIHLLQRGDIRHPGPLVQPGALTCVPGLEAHFRLSRPDDEGSRRVALARWLIDSRNGLTWRSIANRIWQYHFGRGLVDTPNDFGRMGSPPTHPELLDWLAVTLQQNGGSLKALHRLIVTSAVYRQASVYRPAYAAIDTDNRFLWRMNRQRLDAEAIHDAVLQFSSRLDRRMGGPSDRPFIMKPGIHVTPNVNYRDFDPDAPANNRRSVYRFLFRTLPDPFMDAFDCPDGSQVAPVRTASVTALQALALLHDRFLVRQCEHIAERIAQHTADPAKQIALLYRLLVNRKPTGRETQLVSDYTRRHGLANTCRMLLNCNEFMFID